MKNKNVHMYKYLFHPTVYDILNTFLDTFLNESELILLYTVVLDISL